MNPKIYKHACFSMLFINSWTLYGFFDFYLASQKFNGGSNWGLLEYYFYSILVALAAGSMLLLVRLAFQIFKKRNPFQTNFLYVLSGLFNLNLFVVSVVAIGLEILHPNIEFLLEFVLPSLLVGVVTLWDIYRANLQKK